MRVLMKPKNPTLNEWLPSLFDEDYFLFDGIFTKQSLVDKIYEIYGVTNDIDGQIVLRVSFDSELRIKHGCREVDSTVLCMGIINDFTPITDATTQTSILSSLFSTFTSFFFISTESISTFLLQK